MVYPSKRTVYWLYIFIDRNVKTYMSLTLHNFFLIEMADLRMGTIITIVQHWDVLPLNSCPIFSENAPLGDLLRNERRQKIRSFVEE